MVISDTDSSLHDLKVKYIVELEIGMTYYWKV